MRNKAFIAVSVVILIFVLNLSVMANQEHMSHSVNYNMEGRIEFKKQAGFLEEPSLFLPMTDQNTGGEFKQTISGDGELSKSFNTVMIKNKIEVEDTNQLLTSTEASAELDLITVFDRSLWGDADWATRIAPDPGEIGLYDLELVSAMGPQHRQYFMLWDDIIDINDIGKDEFAYDYLNDEIVIGPEFVGNYFEIDQYLYVAQGLTERYITLGLTEEMTVEGMSEIEESLEVQSIPAGEDLAADWAALFNSQLSDFRTISSNEAYYSKRYADYLLDGNIELEKQIGILHQEMIGDGILAKTITVDRLRGYIEVDDVNYIETALDAEEELTLTSVIRPTLPPFINVLLDDDDALAHILNLDHGYSESIRYQLTQQSDDYNWWYRYPIYYAGDTMLFGPYQGSHSLHPLLYYLSWLEQNIAEELTEQVWATKIAPEPGHSGQLNLSFEQANQWPSSYYYIDDTWGWVTSSRLFSEDRLGPADGWWVATDKQGIYPVIGDEFIGNYLTLEQYTQLSMGTTKRYIDLSSIWSGAYLHEDVTVEGRTEIRDVFEMIDLPAGSHGDNAWWRMPGSDLGHGYQELKEFYLPGQLIEEGTMVVFREEDIPDTGEDYIYIWENLF